MNSIYVHSSGSTTRRMLAAAAIAGIGLALIMSVKPVLGTTPTYVSGNVNSCEDLELDGALGVNIDSGDVTGGTTETFSGAGYTIDITADDDLTHFSFANADPPVLKIAVKAADGYFVYDYTPGGATSDTGLITPNTSNNDPKQPQAGLSHLFICFGEAEASHSAEQSVKQSAEGSVKAGTGTPAGSQPNTSLIQGAVNALPTVAFSLILLTSLGALAFANVRMARRRR